LSSSSVHAPFLSIISRNTFSEQISVSKQQSLNAIFQQAVEKASWAVILTACLFVILNEVKNLNCLTSTDPSRCSG